MSRKARKGRAEAASAQKLRRERDKARADAKELRRERDEARADAKRLAKESNDLRAELDREREEAFLRTEALGDKLSAMWKERDETRVNTKRLLEERDEARAEIERLLAELRHWEQYSTDLRAELHRVTTALNEARMETARRSAREDSAPVEDDRQDADTDRIGALQRRIDELERSIRSHSEAVDRMTWIGPRSRPPLQEALQERARLSSETVARIAADLWDSTKREE